MIGVYKRRFGDLIVPLRREHIADFYTRRPVWLVENLGLDRIRDEAADMEREAREFYAAAAGRSSDVATRTLLGDLAAAEAKHQVVAGELVQQHLDPETRKDEDLTSRRQLILTWIQPGLAGLMDGSVSTLAPISRLRSQRKARGRRFWWACQLQSAPASLWVSRKRLMMTASYQVAVPRGNEAWRLES